MSLPDDRFLDRAVAAARAQALEVPDERLDAAADRIRQRIGLASGENSAATVLSCADIQVLLAQRQQGTLSPARAMVVADHVKDCFACRRAERELREAHLAAPRADEAAGWSWTRMAAAAALVAALGAGAWFARDQLMPAGEIEVIAGQLMVPATGELIGAGATIATDTRLRTPAGEGAIVRLADGSRIELDQRSSLAVETRTSGTVLRLDRGRLLVEAAKQHDGDRLQVRTNDSLVTVVGTVFSVNAGMMGSRVGVFEGSVRVGNGAQDSLLGPGDQVVSSDRLEKVDLSDEISWSRDPERYLALLRELGAIDDELAALPREGLRNFPSLGEQIPAGIQAYVALPNATERIAESWAIAADRLSTNPAVSAWWSELEAAGTIAEIDRAIAVLSDVGQSIGDEVVVIRKGTSGAVLAGVLNAASLQSTLLATPELAELGAEFTVVTGGALPAGTGPALWLTADLVAIGDLAMLREIEATRGGAPSWQGEAIHTAALDRYRRGVELLVVAQPDFDHEGDNAPHLTGNPLFVLEDRVVGTRHETRLSLDAQEGAGLPEPLRWIAEPAAIGALELVSADASAAVAFAVADPRQAAEALVRLGSEHDSGLATHLAELRDQHGIDVIEDLAAPLGGEMVLALDGPIVPKPAWKLVLEVNDPARLDFALERMVTEIDAKLREHGGQARVSTTSASGVDAHLVEITNDEGATTSFVWAHLDGYLVAAPSIEAIARARQSRDSGHTLGRSQRLRQSLPVGSENGISGLIWVDLRGAAGVFDLLAGSLPSNVREEASQLLLNGEPLVGVLLAGENHIELAGSRAHSPLGWLRLALLAGVFGGDHHGDAS